MKNQINDLLRQTINEVNNGHCIYTKDEVTNLLWTIQAKVEDIPNVNNGLFSKNQFEQMLTEFGNQLMKSRLEYIERMNIELDEDSIEIHDYRDMDIQIGRDHKIELTKVGEGGVAGVVVDPIRVFQAAILNNCSGIILSHNHPSGSLTPSTMDDKLTMKLKEAGKFLDIQLLDHLILSEDKYYSYADEGTI